MTSVGVAKKKFHKFRFGIKIYGTYHWRITIILTASPFVWATYRTGFMVNWNTTTIQIIMLFATYTNSALLSLALWFENIQIIRVLETFVADTFIACSVWSDSLASLINYAFKGTFHLFSLDQCV